LVGRACTEPKADGSACRATPLRNQAVCFWHSPDTADELAEARRTGGFHRRKKRTVAAVYNFSGLRSVDDHLDLLETITVETLALENSLARNNTVARLLGTGAKLLELGDLATRLAALEAVVEATPTADARVPDDI
jgi:hypothetical protein